MVNDRKYDSFTEYNFDEEETGLLIKAERTNGDQLNIHICMDDRVGVKFARSVMEHDKGCDSVIVSIDGPTPFTKKQCNTIQFFTANELSENVTHHCLVPRHEKVDYAPQNIPAQKLPRILETDKIVQYYNWPCGTIVKIKRVFGGHEPVCYFRVVVPVCM